MYSQHSYQWANTDSSPTSSTGANLEHFTYLRKQTTHLRRYYLQNATANCSFPHLWQTNTASLWIQSSRGSGNITVFYPSTAWRSADHMVPSTLTVHLSTLLGDLTKHSHPKTQDASGSNAGRWELSPLSSSPQHTLKQHLLNCGQFKRSEKNNN